MNTLSLEQAYAQLIADAARRLVVEAGIAPESAERLAEDAARVAAASGRSIAEVIDWIVTASHRHTSLTEAMGRDLLAALDESGIREGLRNHAPFRRAHRTAPRVTGWQIGGIRAARRNRLRGRRV